MHRQSERDNRERDVLVAYRLPGFYEYQYVLLIKATQTLPIGTAYAVWTGIGAVGTVLAGILIFKEPATVWRLVFIMTLIGSIIGLKVVSH